MPGIDAGADLVAGLGVGVAFGLTADFGSMEDFTVGFLPARDGATFGRIVIPGMLVLVGDMESVPMDGRIFRLVT